MGHLPSGRRIVYGKAVPRIDQSKNVVKNVKEGELSFSQHDERRIDQFKHFADREGKRPERQNSAVTHDFGVTDRVVPAEVA